LQPMLLVQVDVSNMNTILLELEGDK